MQKPQLQQWTRLCYALGEGGERPPSNEKRSVGGISQSLMVWWSLASPPPPGKWVCKKAHPGGHAIVDGLIGVVHKQGCPCLTCNAPRVSLSRSPPPAGGVRVPVDLHRPPHISSPPHISRRLPPGVYVFTSVVSHLGLQLHPKLRVGCFRLQE
eukprot:6486151-Amphidinium_carterae.1